MRHSWHHERVSSPHVALVSWGFPPFRGSGTFRPLAVANALARAGVRVTVLAAARETFLVHYGADPALESQIDAGVDVLRIPWYPESRWPLVNDWGPVRAADPRRHVADLNKVVPTFPEKVYDTWLPRITDALESLHQRDPLSLLIATGSPYGDLEAAVTVGTAHDIPVVLDDRDSFLADVFTGDPHPLFEARVPFAQRWFAAAREVWFVNPPIAAWHRQRFPQFADRFHVVENGWDPGAVATDTIPPTPGEAVRMGYVGLIPSNFPMTTVLAAWEQVRSSTDIPLELQFTGPLGYEVDSPKWRHMAELVAAAPGVSWRGHLSRSELAGVYAELDALLLAKEGGAMVTGGKTYEYAATGLPIAGLIDPGSDAVRVLSAYPRLHLTESLTDEAAATALAAAIDDARTGGAERLAAAQSVGADLSRQAALTPAVDRVLAAVRG